MFALFLTTLRIIWYSPTNLLAAHRPKLGLRQLVTSGTLVLAGMLMAMSLAAAQTNTINTGIFGGGSTLASQSFRQLFDCYMDMTVAGDTFSISGDFDPSTPTPGLLPTSCATGGQAVEGLYAGVGSGNGTRAYIANLADQLFGGTITPPMTFNPSSPPPLPSASPFPSVPPPYVDSNNTNVGTFCAYPYPQMDIGFSDSPLPDDLTTEAITFMPSTGWLTGCTTVASTITATGQTLVPYDTTNWGNPIQLPAFEVAATIAVNTTNTATVTWTINGKMGTPAPSANGAGDALPLTGAQACAVFSGEVTDWSSTESIAVLTNTGLTSNRFNYANTINGTGPGAGTDPGVTPSTPNGTPYVNGPLAINVVYRLDGSGTSFIMTNFLHNYCPLLDDGLNGYAAIFGNSNLPNTTFQNLIDNINNFVPPAGGPAHSTANFVGETGSDGVAAAIGNSAAGAGFIGYLSADFTFPYSGSADAPHSASIQNENERINGADVPGQVPTVDSGNFITPTPSSVDIAWQSPAPPLQGLVPPAAGSTYQEWNVYGQVFTAGIMNGNVNVGGLSILPLIASPGAYPLSGTTFVFAYSCYATSTRANNLVNFLEWLYGTDNPGDILMNNGFSALTTTWRDPLVAEYLTPGSANMISFVTNGMGCPAGAMGAH